MRISKKYAARLQDYKGFVERDWPEHGLDFSEAAAEAMFLFESRGEGKPTEDNGYQVGKRWWDWQVENWRQDLRSGLLLASELYADESLPQAYVQAAVSSAFGA